MRLSIRHITDPGSALAFAAEPRRLRLVWRYGDQIDWELRLAALSTRRDESGLDAGRQATWLRRVRRDSRMPIETRQRRYAAPTVHACRAVVAVRIRWPERADAFLRHLRVLIMAGEMADDSDTFEIAAERSGLSVPELAAWAGSDEVAAALEEDVAIAAGHRCPSFVLAETGAELEDEGPLELLARAPDAQSVVDVLTWAPYPLATVEVAAVCGRDAGEVRPELAHAAGAGRARFAPIGGDGYWSAAPASGPMSDL